MRIKRVRAKNFRSLADVELDLRDLTVIVGANGAGKSSLLQLLHVFTGLTQANGHLMSCISYYGGFGATLFLNADSPDMELGLAVCNEKDDERVQYQLRLKEEAGSFFIDTEVLVRNRPDGDPQLLLERRDTNLARLVRESGGEESAQLTNVPHSAEPSLRGNMDGNRDAAGFLNALSRTSIWDCQSFHPSEQARAPQQLEPAVVPLNNGANLLSVLYSLKLERRDAYEELLETLRIAIPEFKDVDFPVVGAGHVYLRWTQSNLSRDLSPKQLSDGTLRLLWLLTVLLTVPDDGLVLIDEPELSLHPQWLQLIVSMMRKTSARTTIVVATQSAEMVRWLEPNELLISDMEDGAAKFTWADGRSDLGEWLKDFTLSEMWTMGELGGRR